jgi:hypothetical protein
METIFEVELGVLGDTVGAIAFFERMAFGHRATSLREK